MDFDSSIFINLFFVLSIVLFTTSLYLVIAKNNLNIKNKIIYTLGETYIFLFKKLIPKDYLAYEKYQIWRYTIYKGVSSKIFINY